MRSGLQEIRIGSSSTSAPRSDPRSGHDEGCLTPRRAIGPRSVLPNKSAISGFGALHDEDLLPAEELGPREVPPTRITTRSRCCTLPLRPRGDVSVT